MDDSDRIPRLMNEMATGHACARLHSGRARAAIALALLLASCTGQPHDEVDAGTGAGPDAGVEAGQDAGSDAGSFALQPKPTAEGTPIGDAVVVSVGPGGGTVASQDGVISLNIPANAVSAATDISVQTITNTAWGGLGNAYRLSPADLVFAQPVQLTFKYTDEELGGLFVEALGIAVQDSDGYWHSKQTVARDETARTLTISTTSFGVRRAAAASRPTGATSAPPGSTVARHQVFRLSPARASVAKSKTQDFHVEECEATNPSIGWPIEDETELAECTPLADGLQRGKWGLVGRGSLVAPNDALSTVTFQAPVFWADSDRMRCPPADACVTKELTLRLPGGGTVTKTGKGYIDIPCIFGFSRLAGAAAGVCAAPTWTGTASEQADLSDGQGGTLHRHQSATVTWTWMPQDPTGTVFTASGSVVVSASGTAGPCTIDLPATTLQVTGTLQFFPDLTPPKYTASGSPTGASCLDYTYTCPDGTTTICGDLKPWLQLGQEPLPDLADTISGTSVQGGISYNWSFARNPPHAQ